MGICITSALDTTPVTQNTATGDVVGKAVLLQKEVISLRKNFW
jgi:hypothetical protein